MCSLIQEARRGSSCRCGRWRTTRWTCTTWWTSPSLWRMIWTPSVTWAPSWPMKWASSPATSDWASAPLWTRTCPLSLTRQKNIKRILVAGRLGHCSGWDSAFMDWPSDSQLFIFLSLNNWWADNYGSQHWNIDDIKNIRYKWSDFWDSDFFSTWGCHH